MNRRFFMIWLSIVLLHDLPLAAQNRYTDSLYEIVNREGAADRDKIVPLSLLAHTVRYYDTTEAFRLAARALTLASSESDARYKVYAYVARASIYLKLRDVPKNIRDADSSLYFAGPNHRCPHQSLGLVQQRPRPQYGQPRKGSAGRIPEGTGVH